MIKAYHRVSSNAALKAIQDAGQIVPAAYRLDPSRIWELCQEDVGRTFDMESPAGLAITELVEEAVAYFETMQMGLQVKKTSVTALKCIDILSGDAGRVFLSPGTWSEAGRGLGWPLSGFVFDAEALIGNGALLRKWDFFSSYSVALRDVVGDTSRSVDEIKDRFLTKIKAIHERQLSGAEAMEVLRRYEMAPGEEHLKPYKMQHERGWSVQEEIVWNGPLPLGLAAEVWEDDRRTNLAETHWPVP
jgi:hypothetical protein